MMMLGILSALIIVHEFGHFFVARFFGFQTPVFGFGLPFGPSWTLGEKWGTQFKIHALLLGGYVAIPELGDESSLAHDAYGVPLKPFQKFPIWQRALVAFAGVAMNMVFAYLVIVAMVATLGAPVDKVYVESFPERSVAREVGVLPWDRIVAIDSVQIKNTDQVITYLSAHKGKEVNLHLLREPEELRKTPEGEAKAQSVDIAARVSKEGKLGMSLTMPLEKINGSPLELLGKSYTELADLTVQMVTTLCRMLYDMTVGWVEHSLFKPKGDAPAASLGDLHGVLVVIKWGADLAEQDWTKLFTFTALISMDLAIVNLLPIPALDGGHLFFMLLEAIRGKPMDEKIQGEMVKWGFISLIALMAVIMVNDVRALISGELDFKLKSKGQKIQGPKNPSSQPANQTNPATKSGNLKSDKNDSSSAPSAGDLSPSQKKQEPSPESSSKNQTESPAPKPASSSSEAAQESVETPASKELQPQKD